MSATWSRICFEGAKTHVVDDSFRSEVIDEMFRRDCRLKPAPEGYDPIEYAPIKDVKDWRLDLGGACFTDEPMIDLGEINGLTLDARCTHVRTLLAYMQRLYHEPLRAFADGRPYRKMHIWVSCLVLSLRDFDEVFIRLQKHSASASQIAADFDKKVLQRLRERNR